MNPNWLDIALREIDVAEFRGADKHNSRIIEYHHTTDLKATSDEVPWCSSYVNWCMQMALVPRTKSAAARSWLAWGVPMARPATGAVAVLTRGTGPQPGPEVIDAPGHVGFYLGYAGLGRILVLGGNQGDTVSIELYPITRVLGYLWPS